MAEYTVPAGYANEKKDVNYGKVVEITYPSKTTGTDRKANIILPAGFSEEKKYRVLYLLHGIGGDHNEWIGGGAATVLYNMMAAGEAKDLIAVVPNVRARANDAANPEDIFSIEHFKAFDNFMNDLKNDLMPFINANYPVFTDRKHTAIAGLSMGGRETLNIGFHMYDTFGYIGAFTPAPGLFPYENFGVYEEGLFTEDTFKLPEGSDHFVMIVEGATDDVVKHHPRSYHEALVKNGTEHIFYTTEGGHEFKVWLHGLYNYVKNIF